MKNISLLIKPASNLCNLKCKYCFYNSIAEEREIESYGFMSLLTLENIVKKAFDFSMGGECSFSFQGGEPTLIGLEFFENFIQFIKKYNKNHSKIHLSLQTNGTLINKEWCQFLKENNFLVGLSLDGDSFVHDSNRVLKKGGGTHENVMRCKNLFDCIGIEYNILTVIDNYGAENIVDTYQFLKKLNIQYMQFIPCLAPLKSEKIKKENNLSKENYLNFLKTLFDIWYADFEKGIIISNRYYENILMNLLRITPECCGMRGSCSIQNVIEADGTVYPCDFYVYEDMKLGDINSQELQEIIFGESANKFLNPHQISSKKCSRCKWFQICRGGCKRYRYNDEEHLYCHEIYQFLEYSIERFLKIANQLCSN